MKATGYWKGELWVQRMTKRKKEGLVGKECPTDCKQFPNEKTCWANPICKKKVGEEQ